RRARGGGRREVRRRRAARRTAASDRRPQGARVRRDRGSAPPRSPGPCGNRSRRGPRTGAGAVPRPALSARRLLGLDRSGPPPPQTAAGAPLRPWTIPNAIGFLRAALIPVILILDYRSAHGTDTAAAILFFLAGAGDYADG